jgi:hypothetical protein
MNARARAGVAVVLAGAFIGLLGRGSDHLPDLVRWSAALGGPWLVTAFFVGAYVRAPGWGALAGGTSLTLGVAIYYAVFHWVERTASLGYAVVVGTAWGAVAFLAGAVFGYAGARWRAGSRRAHIVAGSLLAGALLGEAILLLAHWSNPTARTVLLIELAVGGLVPLLTSRRRELPAAVALAAVFAMTVLVSEHYTRAALHVVGWGGA